MNLELVTVGTELLLGLTIDTNGAEIARSLAEIGVRVVRRTSVGDEPEAIRDGVREALARTGAVITTGGLGPTRDDITKKVVADLFDAPLDFDETVWQAVLDRYARFGRTPTPSNRSQAEVPRGARPCCPTGGAPRPVSGWRVRPDSPSCCPACPGRCGTS